MVRRTSPGNVSALRAPLIAAVVAAGFMPPGAAHAGSAPDASRSVLATSSARDDIASFMQFIAVADTTQTGVRGLVQRAFGVQKTALPLSSDSKPLAPMRQLIVADADPYFERWQKDANERLKEEAKIRTVKQHPFALANPDKMVVVCEAGCRTPKDEIVYIAALVPAVEPPRTFDPTSSEQNAPVDEGHMPCIAGCYERPERNKPATPTRKAETREMRDAAPAPAPSVISAPTITGAITPIPAAKVTAKVRYRQIGINGAIVEQRMDAAPKPMRRSALPSKSIKATALRSWRTKVMTAGATTAKTVHPVGHPSGHLAGRPSGWRTTVVKQSPVFKRIKATDRIRATTRPAAGGTWRTKIAFEGEARHLVRH